jgi:glycosyltransferase involved in cell wall biosynthesis
MKLHFSNVNFSSCSGPNTFAHRLANELAKRGYEIVSQNEDYNVFLCFIEPASMPKKGSKFIHRLDGIWFKPEQYETHNRNIKWAYENSDHVIWQSNFDKNMTLKYWGTPKKGTVVYNGIGKNNLNFIHPDIEKIKNTYDKIFVCSASWHRQKRLKENIEFYKKNRSNNDVLLVLGKYPDYIENSNNIHYLGHLSHELCLQIYSISNWFLHLAWLDHCPNVVVEALSQGCPVICTDSGGTKEIVKNNGIVLKEENEYKFELTDYDSPYTFNTYKINLPEVIVNCDYLDIKYTADKYEELFKWD